MPTVHEVNDIDELAGYRLLWSSLLPQTAKATFFQSLDWLEVHWRRCGRDQRLRVLIVSAGGRPIGILPLVVRTERSRVGPLRVLTYPLHDWGTFYGPIGPNPAATLLLGLAHVRRTPRDWDLVDLRWVDAAGNDLGRTPHAMRLAGFRPGAQAWAHAPVVEMSVDWEEYWQSRSAKWRANVRRLERRLAQQGEVTHVRFRPKGHTYGDGDPRWDLYDQCLRVAERSWQADSTNGTTLCHPSVATYLRDTHAAAAKAGSVDLNLLLLDECPVAFAYNYYYRGSIYGLRMGFDPRLTPYGPGTVLQKMVIEDSFRRGDQFYDLGVGSLPAKRRWQTSLVTSYRYTHFPAIVPRTQLLRMKRWLQDRFHGAEKAALSRSA